jgi:3D (Asp-Asp-Asp) domain-containing protein
LEYTRINYIFGAMKVIILLLLLFPKTVGDNKFIGKVPRSNPIQLVNPIVVDTEIVTLTIYSPLQGETDSTPNITASGFKIDVDDPGKHKIIAVSRDLKSKWKFNQKVKVSKAGKYNGIYTIKDVMNKRHKKRIDILVGLNEKPIKLRGIEVTLIK